MYSSLDVPGALTSMIDLLFLLEVQRTEGVKSMQLNLNAYFLAYPYPYLPLLMIVKG